MTFTDLWASTVAFVTPLASDIVVAVVVLLIGVVIAKVLERVVMRGLHELDLNKWLRKAGVKFPLEQTLAHAVKYLLYFLAVIIALNQVGLTSFVLNIIAVAVLVLVIVGVVLGIKDFLPNFIAGITIHRRGYVKLGDVIRVRDIEGEVRQINLLETRIRTVSGDVLFVPNSLLATKEVLRFKRKKTLLK